MTLPTIHPLRGDKALRWTDETKTKCGCDHCQHWSPLVEHLEAQLNEKGRKLLAELTTNWMNAGEERDVAEAKLAGTWPGWGWLPAAIKQQRHTPDRKAGL